MRSIHGEVSGPTEILPLDLLLEASYSNMEVFVMWLHHSRDAALGQGTNPVPASISFIFL